VTEGADLPQLLTDSKDFDSFVKQAVDYQAMQGSSIRIPGENASPEDREAFYGKLTERVPGLIVAPNPEDAEAMKAFHTAVGVPEEKDGYELPAPPEGTQVNEALQTWFLESAHERKLSKAQAKGLYEDFNTYQQTAEAAALASLKEQETALRTEWGATYDPQMAKIDTLWANYPEFQELRENAKKGLVPAHVLKGFAKLAEGMMGKGFTMLSDGQHQQSSAMTPMEAKRQAEETLTKLTKLEPSDPQRPALMHQLLELNKLAMPDADHKAPARAGFSS
jgi:hypothetical protein